MDPLGSILTWVVSNPTAIPFAGIITFAIIGLFRGWIVPRSVMVDRMADKQTQIDALVKERDQWKEAYDKKAEVNAELLKQNGLLLEGAETTNKLLDALRMRLEWGPPTGQLPPSSPPQKEIEE